MAQRQDNPSRQDSPPQREEAAGRDEAPRREEILDAAVALADARGLAAVSMRGVAERVGVTPMALYPYVGSKAALLDGMVGRLLSQLTSGLPGSGAPSGAGAASWADRLGWIARAARAVFVRHPWAASLLFARPAVTAESVATVDLIYGALLDAGVPAVEVPRLERLISTVIIGFAASEAGGRFGASPEEIRGRRGQLAEGELPAHGALAAVLASPVDWDAEFEADLASVLGLIRAAAGGGPDPR